MYSNSPEIIRRFALSHGWHHDEHQDNYEHGSYDRYMCGDNMLEVEFDPRGRVWHAWINSHWHLMSRKMVLDELRRIAAKTPSLEVDHSAPPGRQETE